MSPGTSSRMPSLARFPRVSGDEPPTQLTIKDSQLVFPA